MDFGEGFKLIDDNFFVAYGEERKGMIFGQGVHVSFAVFELSEDDGNVVELVCCLHDGLLLWF